MHAGEKPASKPKTNKSRAIEPPIELEEIEETVLTSPVDSLSKNIGIEAEGQADEVIVPAKIITRKAGKQRPVNLKFKDPSKTTKKSKEDK